MKKTFQWRDSFETGHPVIDEQHRALLECLQGITGCLGGDKDSEAIEQCRKFRALLQRHFAEEEDILDQAKFPRMDEHRETHRETLERFERIYSGCGEACAKAGKTPCMEDLAYLLFDHFLRGDLDFKSYLQTRKRADDPS